MKASKLTLARTVEIADPRFRRILAATCDEVPTTKDGQPLFDRTEHAALVTVTVNRLTQGKDAA